MQALNPFAGTKAKPKPANSGSGIWYFLVPVAVRDVNDVETR